MLTVENKTVDQVMSHGDTDSTIPQIESSFMARYKDAYRNELDHFLDVIEGMCQKQSEKLECSGSVVERLTRDRGAVVLSLTKVTVLCP